MMIVIADTSPLHYLILLEHTEILQHLYGRVIIPRAVAPRASGGENATSREAVDCKPSILARSTRNHFAPGPGVGRA